MYEDRMAGVCVSIRALLNFIFTLLLNRLEGYPMHIFSLFWKTKLFVPDKLMQLFVLKSHVQLPIPFYTP